MAFARSMSMMNARTLVTETTAKFKGRGTVLKTYTKTAVHMTLLMRIVTKA